MPKLKVLSGREVRAMLEANGFILDRQRGSHMTMKRADGTGKPVTVPDHREVKRGTLAAIIADSELPRSLFMTQ
jgi:predicted RNA binding protein YcfA (HicA-like mRNA interferase family)